MPVVAVHQINDLLRHTAEVEDGGIRVKASGVELVAVLHGQLGKCGKVFSAYCFDHLYHPAGDHRFGSVLCPNVDTLV